MKKESQVERKLRENLSKHILSISPLFENTIANINRELAYVRNIDMFVYMIVERFIFYRVFKLIKKEIIEGNLVYTVLYRGDQMEIHIIKDGAAIRRSADKHLTQNTVAFSGNEIITQTMKLFLSQLDRARRGQHRTRITINDKP